MFTNNTHFFAPCPFRGFLGHQKVVYTGADKGWMPDRLPSLNWYYNIETMLKLAGHSNILLKNKFLRGPKHFDKISK